MDYREDLVYAWSVERETDFKNPVHEIINNAKSDYAIEQILNKEDND